MPIRVRPVVPEPLPGEKEENGEDQPLKFLSKATVNNQVNLLNERDDLKRRHNLEQKIKQDLHNSFLEKIMNSAQQKVKLSEFYYQVTFCEVKYCHRFANFEVPIEIETQFTQAIS